MNISRRNPLPGWLFFPVPIALVESGLLSALRSTELKRYLTLLRVANYSYGNPLVAASLSELRKLDGVSERAAWYASTKLEEFGLVQLLRKTKPFSYLMLGPAPGTFRRW